MWEGSPGTPTGVQRNRAYIQLDPIDRLWTRSLICFSVPTAIIFGDRMERAKAAAAAQKQAEAQPRGEAEERARLAKLWEEHEMINLQNIELIKRMKRLRGWRFCYIP